MYQSAIILPILVLSDGQKRALNLQSLVFVAESDAAGETATNVAIKNGIITATDTGDVLVSASFVGVTTQQPLAISVVDTAVKVQMFTGVQMRRSTPGGTFAALPGTSSYTAASATFTDGRQWPTLFGPAGEIYLPGLVSFSTETPARAEVHPTTGLITLRDNFHKQVRWWHSVQGCLHTECFV